MCIKSQLLQKRLAAGSSSSMILNHVPASCASCKTATKDFFLCHTQNYLGEKDKEIPFTTCLLIS